MSNNEPKEPVSFTAELVAMGDPHDLDVSQHSYDDTAVLVFVAPVEEVRKAAPLFRAQATLSTGAAFDDGVRMYHAVFEEIRKQRARAERALKVLRFVDEQVSGNEQEDGEVLANIGRHVRELLASEGT